MADNKSKPKENPTGGTEAPKLGEIKKPENLPQIAGQKTEVKKETTKGTSEMKLEVLQMELNPDKETPTKIDKLDTNGNLESKEQKEGFDLLQTVTGTTLLAMLFDQGISKESLKKFESLAGINSAMLAKLNPAERISLKKIQEISSKPGTALYTALKERWDKLVDRAKEIYDGAKKAKQSLESPKAAPVNVSAPEKEPTTFFGKIAGFAKDHPILTAGIAIGGAYAVYKIFKWFSSDDDESEKSGEKKEGFMDKILGSKWASRLKWGLGLSAGIFVLGRLIGNEDIGKWLKDKLGINITGNRLSQFLILLSHGDFMEAFKVLLAGPDENFEVHRRMAEKISKEMGTTIDPETLKSIGGIKYEDFMSTISEGKSAIAGVLGKIPGLNLIVGSSATAEQEKVIRNYFEAHKQEIERFRNPTTTVDNVLTNLDGAADGKTILAPEIAAINSDIEKLPPETKAGVQEIQQNMLKVIPEEAVKKIIIECKKLNIDTKKLEDALAERRRAIAEYQQAIRDKADLETIGNKAEKVFDTNKTVCDLVNDTTNELMKRRGWTETEVLAITHLPKFISWFRQPAWRKEYGKYLVEKYIKAPLGVAKDTIGKVKGDVASELIGREFKPNALPGEIDSELKKTKDELKTAEASLEERKNQPKTKPDDEIKREVGHAESKVELLKKDVDIHDVRKTIAEKKAEVLKLRANNGGAKEIAEAEKIIIENESKLKSLMKERLKVQGDFLTYEIAERRAVFLREFGTDGKKGVLTKTYIEQMDTLQNSIGSHRKQVDVEIARRMEEAENLAKQGKSVREVAKDINELRKTRIRIDVGAVDTYQSLAKSWTTEWNLKKALKGGGAATPEIEQMMKTEKNEMQKLWYKMLTGQQDVGKAAPTNIMHSIKGKLYFYGAFVAIGSAINLYDKREGEDWTKSIEQAAVDTLPFVSTYSDFYSAIKGEELITGRKLEAKDQAIRAVFGVGSALCDATEFAGAFMRLRAAYGAAKEAKAVGRSMEIGEALRVMEKEGKTVDSIEALREMSKTGHWVNKMALGGALGLAGYSLIYAPVSSVEIKPETKAILGDQIQDVNVEPPKIDKPISAL